MQMTLRQFIAKASTLKDELLDKEIVIEAPNGLLMSPEIKFIKKDNSSLAIDGENVEKVIITA